MGAVVLSTLGIVMTGFEPSTVGNGFPCGVWSWHTCLSVCLLAWLSVCQIGTKWPVICIVSGVSGHVLVVVLFLESVGTSYEWFGGSGRHIVAVKWEWHLLEWWSTAGLVCVVCVIPLLLLHQVEC